MKIEIDILSCRECPYIEIGPNETTDGWDTGNDWFCKKMNGKIIAGFVEWHDKPKIPTWCPYIKKD